MTVKIVRETQELPCKMSPAEMAAESQKLVQAEQQLAKLQAAKKEEVAKHNAEIKIQRMAIEESVAKLSTGEEKRPVEVEKRFRYKDDEVDWVRLDTREVVQTLPMDAFDRQESLELDGANKDLPAPKASRGRKAAPEYEGDALPPGATRVVRRKGKGKKS
jgi:hypothetical protein